MPTEQQFLDELTALKTFYEDDRQERVNDRAALPGAMAALVYVDETLAEVGDGTLAAPYNSFDTAISTELKSQRHALIRLLSNVQLLDKHTEVGAVALTIEGRDYNGNSVVRQIDFAEAAVSEATDVPSIYGRLSLRVLLDHVHLTMANKGGSVTAEAAYLTTRGDGALGCLDQVSFTGTGTTGTKVFAGSGFWLVGTPPQTMTDMGGRWTGAVAAGNTITAADGIGGGQRLDNT